MKRVLMVAFHFPPAAGSSGIQRTLRFVQHLPSLGWQPVVLTADARAHERTSPDLMADVPPDVAVLRPFALDTARHLAIAGRYPGFLARPDRWQSWRWRAVAAGLRAHREQPFDALWSTYPIATAHVIAAALRRRTSLPWIADFRDPMAQDGYPADPKTWQCFRSIEQQALLESTRAVFTTPGAVAFYRERYRDLPAQRVAVIENGYDEQTFASAALPATPHAQPLIAGCVTLLHSGIVYPSERDPSALFAALQRLKARGQAAALRVRFRASEHDAMLRAMAARAGVEDLIELAPPISYREAIQEMVRADGLLVMQASNCNAQIPAKVYEYLRAQQPIIGLTDPAGDTASVIRRAGIDAVAPLDDAEAIASLLDRFAADPTRRTGWVPGAEAVRMASRQARSVELAALLSDVAR